MAQEIDRPSVYLETTIPSYLAANPSRDLIVAGHQQITHQWWTTAGQRFELYISEYSYDEIKSGDPKIAAVRLELVRNLPMLTRTQDVEHLTEFYRSRLGLAGKAEYDVPHFAFAVAFEMDYLVTWNCSHIANGVVIRKLIELNAEMNRATPLIVTPEALLA